MKHKIVKFNNLSAGCLNPGCQASIEGSVMEMPQEFLDTIFTSDCPYIYISSNKKELTQSEKVNYLIKQAEKTIRLKRKEIKELKKFWTNKNEN